MTNREITEALFDNELQFETIIYLPGCSAHPSDTLRDLLDMWIEEAQEAFTEAGVKLDLEELVEPGDRDLDEFLSTCARKDISGFLVQVLTPTPQSFHGESGYSFSWGCMRWHWFYTPAIDGAFVERLIKWRDGYIAERRAKADAEKEASNG